MKRRMLGLVTVVLTGLVLLSGCGSKKDLKEDQYQNIQAKKVLVMGLDDTFAPMGFTNEKGDIVGFDVDLAKAVGKKLDLEIKFQTIDWSMKETELNNGNIDVIWNGYTISDERKEKVAFSEPYLENSQIIVVRANSEIETKADLAGKVVVSQQESSAMEAINSQPDILKSFKNSEVIQYASYNDAFNDLDSKRADAIVVDETLGRYYMKQKGADDYKVLADNFGTEEYAIGMRKADKELKEQIDKALEELKADGTYQKAVDKWFAE